MAAYSKGTKSLIDDDGEGSLLDMPNKGVASVYLMRHGQTMLDNARRSDGFLDFPLSDEGRLGLIAAQQTLKTVPIACIYGSDLVRVVETARIMKSGIVSDPDTEFSSKARTWNLGVLAGMRKRYGRPEVQKLIDYADKAPMGGESFNAFKSRYMPWFKGAIEEATIAQPVLVIGSGSNLRLIGQMLLGDADAVDLSEGGLACLHMQSGQWHGEVIIGEDDDEDEIS